MKLIANIANHKPNIGTTWAFSRTLIAVSPILTLIFNSPDDIYISSEDMNVSGRCSGLTNISVTCALESGSYTWISHFILLCLYLFVASGYLPIVSGIVHVYAAFSFQQVLSTVDGGEQAALVFAVLALPICLTDGRWNIWHRSGSVWRFNSTHWEIFSRSTKNVFLFLLKIQICVIYLSAALAKLSVPVWADGTAIYYWAIEPFLPPVSFAEGIVSYLTGVPVVILVITYGTLVLEFLLGISVIIHSGKFKNALLVATVLFHLGIGIFFGIWSFAIVMIGLVVFLLSPPDLRYFVDGIKGLRPPNEKEAMIAS